MARKTRKKGPQLAAYNEIYDGGFSSYLQKKKHASPKFVRGLATVPQPQRAVDADADAPLAAARLGPGFRRGRIWS